MGSRLTCHRQVTAEVYKGLVLAAAHAKVDGETHKWRLKHTDIAQILNIQSALHETTCVSVESLGPNWFSPVGNQE